MFSTKRIYHINHDEDVVTLCTLGVGTAFGESVLSGRPHSVSVIANEPCTLLRVRREDYQDLWEKNSHLMQDIVAPLNLNTLRATISNSDSLEAADARDATDYQCHTSIPITREPSSELLRVGWVLRTVIVMQAPQLIRDRKNLNVVERRCMVGSEIVEWLLAITSSTPVRVHSRAQAAALWQVLLEDGVIQHVNNEYQFLDKYLFYRFWFDGEGVKEPPGPPSNDERKIAEGELHHSLALLAQTAPDATLRQILRKSAHERSVEEVDSVYEELMHIKALAHLSNAVKRELASVIAFETHYKQGKVLFNQGDAGTSWYVILKGSVNVVIVGKGIVCTLHEGDDFGKLALVNDAPRAATIVTNEDNCHFLRVDKEDFNRILRDVEANTVRLKEHGKDVLLLQKMPSLKTQQQQQPSSGSGSHYKYMVMAGTPEKMLEHLLETRIDILSEVNGSSVNGDAISTSSASSLYNAVTLIDPFSVAGGDTFLEDFLLTHIIFMPVKVLCSHLLKHYKIDEIKSRQEKEFVIASKRRVIRFTSTWHGSSRESFYLDEHTTNYIIELNDLLKSDLEKYENSFEDEMMIMDSIMHSFTQFKEECEMRGVYKFKADLPGPIRRLSVNGYPNGMNHNNNDRRLFSGIMPKDEIITRVYCADHTYTTLKTTIDEPASAIKTLAADKLGIVKDPNDLILVEVKSNGERVPFKDIEVSIPTGLTVNGRIFVSPIDHIDALTPLPEQEGPKEGTSAAIEDFSSSDLAYYLTQFSWSLFQNVHEDELIYQVFGRHNYGKITANLDVLMRNFNEIQFWVITEMCLTPSLSKRVQLLRKFIKLAGLCKEHQNLNTFFAIVMGLSNMAVSRLSQTWEKLPNKLKRTFSQYETLIDPSRNHRRYRVFLSKLEPPMVPFTPLLLKDMTFAHEGNKTFLEKGLVNFEKMHMIAQTLRTIRYCRSKPLKLDAPSGSSAFLSTSIVSGSSSSASHSKKNTRAKIEQYIRDIKVIDNQRLLTHLSHSLEHRKI